MAISAAAATTVLFKNSDRQSSTACFSKADKLSHLSSLQFPRELRRFRIASPQLSKSNLGSRAITPLVEAKKQTFNSFDELLSKSEKPVLVDFYATWCGPCQFMVPVLEQVSSTMNDKIQVVKIDTEKYTAIADKYKIAALPTFILFKDGKPCDRFEGALSADQLIERIETSLKVKQ